VINSSEPAWAGAGELVEEASIGAETGNEAYLLGNVTSIAAGDTHIIPTVDGHFWVVRQMAGVPRDGCDPDPDDPFGYDENPCWLELLVADVFDEEGRFLGPVPMPEGIRYHVRPYIRGDMVIAVLEDADGILFLRRYRLQVSN